eukprot:TRINITY_DN78238_c0_g1_i1.p1 TRINITY_DN78238_c0_g1~~TRINITY_DN78238_c0_g1_i1.p1  ORF type:complete len:498 (+),score=75.06 TRINITY_DN78238_c0_g1_i1:201-1496(+)
MASQRSAQLCSSTANARHRAPRIRMNAFPWARVAPPPKPFWLRPSSWLIGLAITAAACLFLNRRRSRSPSTASLKQLEASFSSSTRTAAAPTTARASPPTASAGDTASRDKGSATAATVAPEPSAPAKSSATAASPVDASPAAPETPAASATPAANVAPAAAASPDAPTSPPTPATPEVASTGVSEEITLADGRLVKVTSDSAASATLMEATVAAAKAAIEQKGAFSLAVSSGDVAKGLSGLAQQPGLDFSKFHIFFCSDVLVEVPCYKEARELWLDACGVPQEQVHVMPDISFAEGAAAQYTATICRQDEAVIGDSEGGLPAVDLILLSVGSDGSCGGIRPGSDFAEANGNGQVVLFNDSSEIAVSLDFMSAAQSAICFARGADCAGTVKRALSEKGSAECPAGLVKAPSTMWLLTDASFAEYKASTSYA